MSFFDELPKFYDGKKYAAVLLEDCKKNLNRAGVFLKVISRIKKICDNGNFGQVNKRYKYYAKKNLGWLKWNDGTRIYFSKFNKKQILIFMVSGNKNNQDDDLKEAESIKNEITQEVKKYEKENKK